MARPVAHLPLEIVLNVIDSLVDFGNEQVLALKPDHWRAVQLRQWLLVSKATSEAAARHLYRHCMYIDSHRRLMFLVRTLSPPKRVNNGDELEQQIVQSKHLPYITNLYLAPFRQHLDDLPAAIWIFELLSMVGPRLKRFNFDFPFNSLSGYRDHLGVYRWIRNGLERLTKLEELVYLSSDANLVHQWPLADQYHGLWWHGFRDLKRLVLPYRNLPDFLTPFLKSNEENQATLRPALTHLVIHLRDLPLSPFALELDKLAGENISEPLKVIHVHQPFLPPYESIITEQISIADESVAELHSMVVHGPDASVRPDPHFNLANIFIKREALSGNLWTLPTIKRDPQSRGEHH